MKRLVIDASCLPSAGLPPEELVYDLTGLKKACRSDESD
jgi:hypothetical protein